LVLLPPRWESRHKNGDIFAQRFEQEMKAGRLTRQVFSCPGPLEIPTTDQAPANTEVFFSVTSCKSHNRPN